MTEKDKAAKGFLYDANYDQELIGLRMRCLKLCRAYNDCMPDETDLQRGIMRQIIPEIGGGFTIMQPFRCDYRSHSGTMSLLHRTASLRLLVMRLTRRSAIRGLRSRCRLPLGTVCGSARMSPFCPV